MIDRILAYVAPILLGGPITAIDDVGVLSIAQHNAGGSTGRTHRPGRPSQFGSRSSSLVAHVERPVLDQVADPADPEAFPERGHRVADDHRVAARPGRR